MVTVVMTSPWAMASTTSCPEETFPENRMFVVQDEARTVGDKKLTAVGARPSVRH